MGRAGIGLRLAGQKKNEHGDNAMSKKTQGASGFGILLLLTGIVLMSTPNCQCGCSTLAEHLVKAGINLLAS